MKTKTFSIIFVIILLISIVSAMDISMNAGESYTINVGTNENINWTISGIDESYLNISQNNSNVTILLSDYAPSSNFSIDFYLMREQSSENLNTNNGGGGGYYDPNWKKDNLIIEVNNTDTNKNENKSETEDKNKNNKKSYIIEIIIGLILALSLWFGGRFLLRNFSKNKKINYKKDKFI